MVMTAKYKYSSINEMNVLGDYNFYGIIYDASFPIVDESKNKYECIIKVIDPDVNCLTHPTSLNDNLLNLIIRSNSKESMPYIHSIGDIIRVHRGNYSPKAKKNIYLQLTNVTKIKSSWCVFAGASDLTSKDTNPIMCSHSNYTFESQDRQKIESLRAWIRTHFKDRNSLFFTKETKLSQRNTSGSDNDVLVQVVHKTELDDKIVYFVQDETDGCELHTFKYFNFIDVNDVIRLRSFKVQDKYYIFYILYILTRSILLMNIFSNILKIPQFFDYYKDFMNRLALKIKSVDPSLDVPMFSSGERKSEEVRVADITKIWGVTPVDPGDTQVKRFDELAPEDQKFILEVNILEIYPKPVYNFVNVLCQNCQNSFLTSEVEVVDNNFFCEFCKKEMIGKLHFNVVLQCRENPYANKLIALHLCDYDGEGDNFFGIPAVDFYRNSSEFQKLGEIYKKLTDKDCYIAVKVEAIPTGHSETDRLYRLIGNYQNQIVNIYNKII